MSRRALLYGATGYTGRETAERLAAAGTDVVLAGRNPERVRAIAEPLGLEWRAFDLTNPAILCAALADIYTVLHAAGPFQITARPMLDACLANGTHYLDFNGEWPAFLEAISLDAAARAAGAMVMPGVGLTIAATDCSLALAKQLWPDTVRLCLGVSKPQVITRGTIESAAHTIGPEVLVRRGGQLTGTPLGSLTRAFDFGAGLSQAAAVSWADVVTGALTTGVDNIEVYQEMDWAQRAGYRTAGLAMDLTGPGPWQRAGASLSALWPVGPTAEARGAAHYTMVVEALDPWRRVRRLRMRTCDGYTTSVLTGAAAVERVLAGGARPGFQTPGRAFGPQFVFDTGAAALEAPTASGSAAA
jgi:short subunit dehydrogenase-like uncharacterized protein